MKFIKLLIILIVFVAKTSIASDAEPYFFVFLNSNPDKDIISKDSAQTLQKLHLANIDRLYAEGKIVSAGPFAGGGGLFIFQTTNIDECKDLLNSDPGIKANRWKIEVFPMNILNGGICKLGDEYEMTSYIFVRFYKNPEKQTSNTADLLTSKERLHFLKDKENKIIISASYGKESGGFLILDTKKIEVAEGILKKDPSIKAKILYNSKTLWIAKGCFCE